MLEHADRNRGLRELFDKSLRLGLVHADSAEVEHYYGHKEKPNVIYFERGEKDLATFKRSMIPVQSDVLLESAQKKAQIAMDQVREHADRRERREQFPYAAE